MPGISSISGDSTLPLQSAHVQPQASQPKISPSPSSPSRRILVADQARKETDILELRRTSKMFLIAAAGFAIAAVVAGAFFPPLCALLLVSAGFAYISREGYKDAAKLSAEVSRANQNSNILQGSFNELDARLSRMRGRSEGVPAEIEERWDAIVSQIKEPKAGLAKKLHDLENALNEHDTACICKLTEQPLTTLIPNEDIRKDLEKLIGDYKTLKTTAAAMSADTTAEKQILEESFSKLAPYLLDESSEVPWWGVLNQMNRELNTWGLKTTS